MQRRKKQLAKTLLGVAFGLLLSHLVSDAPPACPAPHAAPRPPEPERLLFVGVMTAAGYLGTRARAVHATWARSVPGRVVFFSAEGAASELLPLVALEGVDDAYPPQRKSFMMLKHMYEHHLEHYEWFMRADDDVYVRTDRLEELLRAVDSRKTWFVGQTGRGKSEEFGMLSLDDDENFCMGGPGVIFSRETLRRIGPHLDKCLAGMLTGHEDVEVGRCVRRYAGISCTWSYEMQVILYHNQSGQAAFTGDLKQKEVHRAITLHPVKQPQYMYRLDKYVKALKIQKLQQQMVNLHRDIAASMSHLGYHRDRLQDTQLVDGLPLFPEPRGSSKYLGDVGLLGTPQSLTRHRPTTLENVLDWELIQKNLYTYKDSNPRKRIGSSLKEGLTDVVRDIMEVINSYSKQRGRVIDFKEILYGYWRLDPVHGVDLILDLLLVYRKYRGHKMTVEVRRHSYVQQTFTGIHVREIASEGAISAREDVPAPVHRQIAQKIISTFEDLPIFTKKPAPKETINFVLPLSGRHDTFRRFLRMYEEMCLRNDENTKLVVVLYSNGDEKFEENLNLLREYQKKYGETNFRLCAVAGRFSRAQALDLGAGVLNPSDLMLFIDVDIIFDTKTLLRIRQNARFGSSVYYPIVYSLYNPALLNKTYPVERYAFDSGFIDEDNGFWRQFGFGIVGLYKADYVSLGGFNLNISGWGMEDVSFYDSTLKSKLKIVRSVDPSLIHVYHPIHCDINLDVAQKFMCLGTKASMLGSLKQLQDFYRKYQHLFVS